MTSTTGTSVTAAETVPQIEIPENVVAEEANTSPQNTIPPPEKIAPDDCLHSFQNFIKSQKKGLTAFYTDETLKDRAENAAEMVNKLREMGCGKETSKELSVLCLYDIVMLIDDSSSMTDEEGGGRIDTLKATMEQITTVYDLARPEGLLSVRFINSPKGLKNIDRQRVDRVMKDRTFWGTTRIGGALKKKIIDNFVFKGTMKKPLLVMIITDGDAEGEPQGHLKTVIGDCVKGLQADKRLNEDAVAFHFSRVGNDEGAARLLQNLDKSYKNVDCLRAEYALEKLKDKDSMWYILPKLLLGAIDTNINRDDNEEGAVGDNKEDEEPPSEEEEEDEEIDMTTE